MKSWEDAILIRGSIILRASCVQRYVDTNDERDARSAEGTKHNHLAFEKIVGTIVGHVPREFLFLRDFLGPFAGSTEAPAAVANVKIFWQYLVRDLLSLQACS